MIDLDPVALGLFGGGAPVVVDVGVARVRVAGGAARRGGRGRRRQLVVLQVQLPPPHRILPPPRVGEAPLASDVLADIPRRRGHFAITRRTTTQTENFTDFLLHLTSLWQPE